MLSIIHTHFSLKLCGAKGSLLLDGRVYRHFQYSFAVWKLLKLVP